MNYVGNMWVVNKISLQICIYMNGILHNLEIFSSDKLISESIKFLNHSNLKSKNFRVDEG